MKPIKTESKALYGSEVLSYYFYFYQQLLAGKNGYSATMGELL
jgi:hypothetical protein